MTPFDHDDLGIDLEWAKLLPECQGCRKKSDGFKRVNWEGVETILCGRHFDEFIARRFKGDHHLTPQAFAKELREGAFRNCWTAAIGE